MYVYTVQTALAALLDQRAPPAGYGLRLASIYIYIYIYIYVYIYIHIYICYVYII